jgi:mono/diheme cytochrome c family protein
MRVRCAWIWFAGAFAVGSVCAAAEAPDLERGRGLYENHCQVCHTPKVHSRLNRLPIDANELRQIVDNWQKEENLRWGPQDVEDVVYYLRQTRYKF